MQATGKPKQTLNNKRVCVRAAGRTLAHRRLVTCSQPESKGLLTSWKPANMSRSVRDVNTPRAARPSVFQCPRRSCSPRSLARGREEGGCASLIMNEPTPGSALRPPHLPPPHRHTHTHTYTAPRAPLNRLFRRGRDVT